MEKLIEFVITIPDPAKGHSDDRCFKLPYMSSEMLAVNSNIFYDAFFKDQESAQSS